MNTHADKTRKNISQSLVNNLPQKQSGRESTFQFVDNRPVAIAQRKLQDMANNSPQAKKTAQLQAKIDNHSVRQQHPIQKKENNTGLPDNLKSGIENLSDYSMDDVKVHYNSDKPAQLNAYAFAQGTDIHLGSGQEKHLPHEAWHVVQQKQGRVKPTTQAKGTTINDDEGLEREADVMGAKATRGGVLNQEHAVGAGKGNEQTISRMLEKRWGGINISAPISLSALQLTQPEAPIQRQQCVVQREETLAENIIRILNRRDIHISDEDADSYAEKLTNSPPNTEIQVFGRHRALKLNAAGRVSSIKRRPPSSAVHMRADPVYGPMEKVNASMIDEGRFPIAGGVLEQDVTIRAADLAQIGPRGNLRTEMGGSAAQLSGIEHSEWLHAVAHSLGGDDKGYNLSAGPHSLNTAMIPFEIAVKQLVFDGKVVDYSVVFFTNYLEDGLLYITHVEIGIEVGDGGRKYWTLHVDPSRISTFINGGVLAEIQEVANTFVASHK